MNRIFPLFLLLYLSIQLSAQEVRGITFRDDLQSAFDLADEEEKLVFLYFHVSDCAACDALANRFRNKSVAKLYNQYYLSYNLDASGKGRALAQKYGVQSFPSLLYLDPEGEVKFIARGYRDGKSLFDYGKMARLPARIIKKEMEKRYRADPTDTDHLYDYIEYLYHKSRFTKVEKLLSEYFDQRVMIDSVTWMNLTLDYASDPNSYAYDILQEEKAEFIEKFGEEYIDKTIWNCLLVRTGQECDPAEFERFERFFMDHTIKTGYSSENNKLILFYSQYLFSNYPLVGTTLSKSDKEIFTKYALAAMRLEDHSLGKNLLISMSIHIISHHQENTALAKLYDVLEHNSRKDPSYKYLDLQSVALYALGKEDAAVQKIIQAREMAMSQGYKDFKPSITAFKQLEILK